MPTESQSRETALRIKVRQRIEQGLLPVMRPGQIFACYGSGQLCAVCEQPITDGQAQYEVKDWRTGRRLRFHSECHAVWQSECNQAHRVGGNQARRA